MAQIEITLALHPRWWMRPALIAAALALKLGLIRAKPDARYHGAMISANERAAEWLANYAFRVESL